jgi:hypothetical protein
VIDDSASNHVPTVSAKNSAVCGDLAAVVGFRGLTRALDPRGRTSNSPTTRANHVSTFVHKCSRCGGRVILRTLRRRGPTSSRGDRRICWILIEQTLEI